MNDHFERLGLPRRFSLTVEEIERNYLARSRAAHPDYHQMGSNSEQRASLTTSAALNEAYTVLRDPFRRAEHLLQLEGGPSASEQKAMPAAFLEEMLELRMTIEEIKSGGLDSLAFVEMENQLAERRLKLLNEVGAIFEMPDRGDRVASLRDVRQLLNAVKYVQGLQRDLQAD